MSDKPLSILLVDDDPHMQNMFRMVSEHHNIELATAHDAESAFDYLRANQPDVIVMDILLPGMDGYQALNYLRKENLAPHINVVATTGYYTADTQSEIIAHGFDGYLPKPIDPKEVIPYLKKIAGEPQT